jgi:GNAT superfamily N-acetyltransferase
MPKPRFTWHPLTPDRWPDFETLFGPRGACGGCWCTVWRRPRSEFEANKGDGNRRYLLGIVTAGHPPGVIGYLGDQPAAWCAVAPRADYPALARSRVLQPVDDTPVWSVSCLFVHKDHRKKGLSVRMLKAAVEHVKTQGGTVVEGYPIEPKNDQVAPVFAWTGLVSAFEAAGFTEVARRSDTRPIMRYQVKRRK